MDAASTSITIVCQLVDCSGTVTLLPAGARAAAKKAKVTYGTAKFAGTPGKAVNVRIKLNSRGRKLLAHRRKATVAASIALTGQATPTVRRLTLRRGGG